MKYPIPILALFLALPLFAAGSVERKILTLCDSLVDRMHFQKVLSEIELSQSGVIDSATALKVCKMVSAPYLLTGTVAAVFGASRITAKITCTETYEIVATAKETVEPAKLEWLTKELMDEKSKLVRRCSGAWWRGGGRCIPGIG